MQAASRQPQNRSHAPAVGHRIEFAALYGAFALIAAVVFGTLSIHPF